MSKQKAKHKRVVRGPQLNLKLGRAKGEPPRTARIRYIEPPAKRRGSPFVAVRIPHDAHAAFVKWCRGKKLSTAEAIRAYVSKVTGVSMESADE